MRGPDATQIRQWDEEGCLALEDAIHGEELHHLQTSFDYWAEQCKDNWLDRVEAGEASATFFDLPDIGEKDKSFVRIVHHSSYYGLVEAFLDGEVTAPASASARMVPPGPVSYNGWHPDMHCDHPLCLTIQIYLNDVVRQGGEFAYVPGSHKPRSGPYPGVTHLTSMPGHRAYPGRAGMAILFNSYGWHTSMDNLTEVPRKSLFLRYRKNEASRKTSGSLAPIADHGVPSKGCPLFGLVVP